MSGAEQRDSGPEIIAHRGYSRVAPENTISALEAALEAGATSVEVDVRTAFDGTPILFHDVHLGRTSSGVGPVRRRTVGQLQSLDAGSWFSDDFAGERIPTLAEALEALAGRVERFYPEVKGYREMEDVDRMVKIVRNAGLLSSTTFLSMDRIVLDRIRRTEPSVKLGYVVEDTDAFREAVDQTEGDSRALIELEVGLALGNPGVIGSARVRELEVGVWTVDDVDDAERLWETGVTRFTTNRLEEMLEWADTHS